MDCGRNRCATDRHIDSGIDEPNTMKLASVGEAGTFSLSQMGRVKLA